MRCAGPRVGSLRIGAALALASVIAFASSRARAQPVVTRYRLDIVGCEIPTLESAVSLEMGDALATDGERSIRIECVGETTRIVAEDTLFAIRIEREMAPQSVEPHLRARVLALVVTQLVRSLERVMSEGPAETERVEDEPVESEPVASLPVETEPEGGAVAEPERTATHRSPLELSFLGGIRLYPIDSTTVLATFEIDLRFDWIAFGVEGGGTQIRDRLARVDLAVLVGNVGVVPLRLSEGLLDAGAGVFVEAGAVLGRTVSELRGFHGSETVGLLLGAFARGWMSVALDPRWSFRASIDVGYDHGLEVVVLGYPTASTHSLVCAVRVGVTSWP